MGPKARSLQAVLEIASGLSLPLEAVTETFAILAKRGKGKSYTGAVLVEELVAAGQPVVVIDPVGVWWGLRSSAEGSRDGLPVVILGGDHGDLPLEPTAGTLIAEVVVDSRTPMVLDVSAMTKSAARRFVTDFLEGLYHRNRSPLHVVIDEADLFAPQRATADYARMLGAVEDLVRRGRARGLGTTLISQRAAAVSKDVLSQTETLIVMGMTSPRDVAAINEWVRLNADDAEAQQVRSSLASLPTGTAWVWSPSWLQLLTKVKVRKRRTFDSSATPKPGQPRPGVAAMAAVDIAALGKRMSELVDVAAAADPKALQRRVRELEAALDKARAVAAPEVVVEHVIERVVPEEIGEVVESLEQLSAALGRCHEVAEEALRGARAAQAQPRPPVTVVREETPVAQLIPETGATPTTPAGQLPKAQRLILSVLATYGPRAVSSVAVLTGYSSKGGGFRNSLSALRTGGLITGRGDLEITPAGRVALGPIDPLPAGGQLREHWKRQSAVPLAAGKVLDALAEAYPEPLSIEQLAEATGYEASGGGFRNGISRLRSLGLASGRGELLIDQDLVDVRPGGNHAAR